MIHTMETHKSFRIDVLILHLQHRRCNLHKYHASLADFSHYNKPSSSIHYTNNSLFTSQYL